MTTNKDKHLEKFIPLVIENAPEFDNFSVFDLNKSLNLNDEESKIFRELTFDIRKYLVNNGIAEMYGSRKITMTEKGRDIKNGTEKIYGTIMNNDFSNSTIGTVVQDSDLNKARINSKAKTQNNTPLKKSLAQKLLSNPWIIGIVFAIITAILNADRIMNFINNIINSL